MIISHGKTMQGTPESAALLNPFITPANPHPHGILVGLESTLNFPVVIDLYLARFLRLTHSARYEVTGQLDAGKSAFMKAVARRTCRMMAFDDPKGLKPVDLRTQIHDRKMGEYRDLTEKLRSTVIRIGGTERFNPFDPRLSMGEVHMVDIAANLCEMAKGSSLTGYEPLALQIGVYLMLLQDEHESSSIERLEGIVLSETAADVADYLKSNSIVLTSAPEMSTSDTMAERMKQFSAPRTEEVGNINMADFLDAAGLVASYLAQLTRGRFGRVLGGNASMFERLTQRITTIEWEESNLEAQDAVEGVSYKWRSIAKNNPQLIRLIPHLEIGDEEGKALKRSPLHLRFLSEQMRDARAMHTAGIYTTQYAPDIANAGGNDPALQAMAEGINNAVAGRIVFRQPNDDTILDILVRQGFSDLEAERTTRMPPYQAAFKLPNLPPIFMRTIMTPTDLKLTYSNKEGDKMVQGRRSPAEDPEWVRRAQMLGITIPGHPATDPELQDIRQEVS